jgi:hypothetical protein
MIAQGQPRARFRRAIQRKNLLGAETCAREMGVVDLPEALDLVCFVAEVAPARLDGFGGAGSPGWPMKGRSRSESLIAR